MGDGLGLRVFSLWLLLALEVPLGALLREPKRPGRKPEPVLRLSMLDGVAGAVAVAVAVSVAVAPASRNHTHNQGCGKARPRQL